MAVTVRIAALLASLLVVGVLGGAPASANPGDPPGALTFGGMQRTYVLHVPPGLEHPAGLVINLHGSGQTGAVQVAVTNYNTIADQYGFIVAYPDGIDMSWADGRGASVPDREGVDDVGFLSTLIDSSVVTTPSRRGGSSSPECRRAHSWPTAWRVTAPTWFPPSRRLPARWVPPSPAAPPDPSR